MTSRHPGHRTRPPTGRIKNTKLGGVSDWPHSVAKEAVSSTQKCLLGTVEGGFLDEDCPNETLHCKSGVFTETLHPVNHKKWLYLLREQLEQSLDDGIKPLREGGTRGVLFQVTLLSHGYTFASKGTIEAFIKDVDHTTSELLLRLGSDAMILAVLYTTHNFFFFFFGRRPVLSGCSNSLKVTCIVEQGKADKHVT